ncbi:hypothetical protein [Methylobacterium sp. 77]|uniref:hypothetical protein n=1 Tax=Methylobacterium sp. 77 TaxID=1101192 RepID=UPI0003AAA57B|nr:hypothetical protein [Methylobacterium sp. 77]
MTDAVDSILRAQALNESPRDLSHGLIIARLVMGLVPEMIDALVEFIQQSWMALRNEADRAE